MDNPNPNPIIPRLSEALGRELAKSGSQDAQAAQMYLFGTEYKSKSLYRYIRGFGGFQLSFS